MSGTQEGQGGQEVHGHLGGKTWTRQLEDSETIRDSKENGKGWEDWENRGENKEKVERGDEKKDK